MKRAALMAVGVLAAMAAMRAGAENKFDYCLLCHGSNANGNFGIRAPSFRDGALVSLRQLENFAAGVRGLPAEDVGGHEMGPSACA